jgi:hypothetical protein
LFFERSRDIPDVDVSVISPSSTQINEVENFQQFAVHAQTVKFSKHVCNNGWVIVRNQAQHVHM